MPLALTPRAIVASLLVAPASIGSASFLSGASLDEEVHWPSNPVFNFSFLPLNHICSVGVVQPPAWFRGVVHPPA